MTWNSITIPDEEFQKAARLSAQGFLDFLSEKGVGMGADYLTEVEMAKGEETTWTYRWRRKDEQGR